MRFSQTGLVAGCARQDTRDDELDFLVSSLDRKRMRLFKLAVFIVIVGGVAGCGTTQVEESHVALICDGHPIQLFFEPLNTGFKFTRLEYTTSSLQLQVAKFVEVGARQEILWSQNSEAAFPSTARPSYITLFQPSRMFSKPELLFNTGLICRGR